jgi:hypothetical protein
MLNKLYRQFKFIANSNEIIRLNKKIGKCIAAPCLRIIITPLLFVPYRPTTRSRFIEKYWINIGTKNTTFFLQASLVQQNG